MEKDQKLEKKRISTGKRLVGFVAIFLVLLMLATHLLEVSENVSLANIKGFYKEPKDSIDVALIGPSEFYADYSPTQAWEEYGYTSYSLAVAGIPGNMYKSMLKEFLKRQSPKLVVFELNGFMQNDSYFERAGKLHTWIDNIPWSINKIETIRENIPAKERYSYYFKLAAYHNNWKNFRACAGTVHTKVNVLMNDQLYTKGFGTYTKCSDQEAQTKTKEVYFTARSERYLKELLMTCKEMGVEKVLFVRFPHGTRIENPCKMKEMQKLIEGYGYDYLDMNEAYEPIGLNLKKDFYNKEHLNVEGMAKLTKYFGKYLCDNYDIKGKHSEEQVQNWNQCAEKAESLYEKCRNDLARGKKRRYSEFRADDLP